MKIIKHLIFASAFLGIIFLNSCASISGYHSGKTVGKGNGEISLGLNVTQSPNFFDYDEETDSSFLDLPFIFFPNFEVGGRYGITEKLDVGIRANTSLNFGADVKYQLVGDQESQFALSVGAGGGMFGITTGNLALINFQFGLYSSFHPSEKIHLYFSPRYIGQLETVLAEATGIINYTGANVGVMFGSEVKFALDFGFYDLRNETINFDANLYNFGIGVLFQL